MNWLEEMAVSQSNSLLDYARVLHAITPADETYLQRLFTKRWFSFDASALPKPFPAPALFLTGRQDSAWGTAAHGDSSSSSRGQPSPSWTRGPPDVGRAAGGVLGPRLGVARPRRTLELTHRL